MRFHPPPSASPLPLPLASQALNELTIRGEIRTTVEYLRKLIELEDFKANQVNTGWLESVMAASSVRADKPDPLVVVRFIAFSKHRYGTKLTFSKSKQNPNH